MHFASAFTLFVLLLVPAAALDALEVPFMAGRVNDLANLLDATANTRLEARLADLERATGAQVAVLTLPSLEGEALEDFSLRVAQTWKLGRKGVDDGVLLFVARNERALRIEVGYGLEATLTDAACGRIIDRLMKPPFRAGDFEAGIEAALDAVAGAVRGEPGAVPGAVEPGHETFSARALRVAGNAAEYLIWAVLLLPFAGIALVLHVQGRHSELFRYFPYLIAIPPTFIFLVVLWIQVGFLVALGITAAWLAFLPIGRFLMPEKWRLKVEMEPGGDSSGSWKSLAWDDDRSRWHSSSASSSGFSGRGGSFGGGGASGGW